jgi:hypothetical protein
MLRHVILSLALCACSVSACTIVAVGKVIPLNVKPTQSTPKLNRRLSML